MQGSQEGNASSTRRYNPITLAIVNTIDFPGRHGVRIFRISRQHLGLAALLTIMLGMPFAFFLALALFWDVVGQFSPLKWLNGYLAPEINRLSDESLQNGFHVKRSLVAAISMVELIFALNVVSLLSRANRKHALMVWRCYDRKKLLTALGVSCAIFLACWFLLFHSWDWLRILTDGDPRGGRIIVYVIAVFPLAAFMAGHLATILIAAAGRTIVLQRRGR
jgi:hypothetical protein